MSRRYFWCKYSRGSYDVSTEAETKNGERYVYKFENNNLVLNDEDAERLLRSRYHGAEFHEVTRPIATANVSQVDHTGTGRVTDQAFIDESRKRAEIIARDNSLDAATRENLMNAVDSDLSREQMAAKARQYAKKSTAKRIAEIAAQKAKAEAVEHPVR